jgi:hypothetical protein
VTVTFLEKEKKATNLMSEIPIEPDLRNSPICNSFIEINERNILPQIDVRGLISLIPQNTFTFRLPSI